MRVYLDLRFVKILFECCHIQGQSVGGIWEDSKEALTIGLKNVLIYITAAGEGKLSLSTALLSLPVCVDCGLGKGM